MNNCPRLNLPMLHTLASIGYHLESITQKIVVNLEICFLKPSFIPNLSKISSLLWFKTHLIELKCKVNNRYLEICLEKSKYIDFTIK